MKGEMDCRIRRSTNGSTMLPLALATVAMTVPCDGADQPSVQHKVRDSTWAIEAEQSLPMKPIKGSQQPVSLASTGTPADPAAKPNTQGRPEIRIELLSTSFELVQIPAGKFVMGSARVSNEAPVHAVEIRKSFWMGKYPVTQRQWKAVMKYNPSKNKTAGEDAPVDSVSSNACNTFIDRLNQDQSVWRFRLPSEAEWEYACRAGTTGESYGNLDAIAWCASNSNRSSQPVGKKQPNAFGLFDMLGNVWQWTNDLQHDTYYNAPRDESVWNTDSYYFDAGIRWKQSHTWFQPVFVTRGGSWREAPVDIRSSRRQMKVHGTQNDDLGFRLVGERK